MRGECESLLRIKHSAVSRQHSGDTGRARLTQVRVAGLQAVGALSVCVIPYFQYHRNMAPSTVAPPSKSAARVAKYADMFSAMGTEPRLRIMQLLLCAHPEGLVVGDIQSELEIPNSTLSHHLEKLRTEGLVEVQREVTFLRYTASAAGTAAIPVCRVLHAQQGPASRGHRANLQIGVCYEHR